VSELSAHELVQTRTCKERLCDREAIALRGPYAGLCDTHTELAKRARAERAALPPAEPPEPQPPRSGRPELAKAVAALQPIARRLERAHASFRGSKTARHEAFEQFKAALEQVKHATEELLAS